MHIMSTIHSDQIPINVHIMSTINLVLNIQKDSLRLMKSQRDSKSLEEYQKTLEHLKRLKASQSVSKRLNAPQRDLETHKNSQRLKAS